MIARPKISRNEWKSAEIGAFEVGNFPALGLAEAHPRAVAGDVEAEDGEVRRDQQAVELARVEAVELRDPRAPRAVAPVGEPARARRS